MKRFWDKVDKSIDGDACWPWKAGRHRQGYGLFRVGGKLLKAHRFAYLLEHGKLPSVVRHSCDNPPCCNPAHLLGGTQIDNMHDRNERGRVARGEENGRSKLNFAQVEEIRRRYAQGVETQRDLAQSFGVAQPNINKIIRGISYPTGTKVT